MASFPTREIPTFHPFAVDQTASAAALGAAATSVHRDHEGLPFVVLPEGYKTQHLESLLVRPFRRRRQDKYADVSNFCDQINECSGDGPNYAVYGVVDDNPRFAAIFNDTEWRDNRILFNCPLSKEWKIWIGSNGKRMSQPDFAQFIEDNAPDCSDPDSATMIEVARTLEAKKAVNFASSTRLPTGETEFTYEETISGTAGKGRLAIPEVFSLSMPVIVGVAPYQVDARLRYRIAEGGKLTLWYDLVRPHKIIEHAVSDVWQEIERVTGMAINRVEEIPPVQSAIA